MFWVWSYILCRFLKSYHFTFPAVSYVFTVSVDWSSLHINTYCTALSFKRETHILFTLTVYGNEVYRLPRLPRFIC